MKTNAKLIVNPNASGGRAKKIANIIGEKYQNLFSEIVFTKRPLEAIELASKSDGFEKLCFIGGDGTLNEVINGVLQIPLQRRPAVGIIPVGTGSDFIKTLGIPKSVEHSVEVIVNGKTRDLDVAKCVFKDFNNRTVERYYINITEFGMGGEVANLVNKYGKVLKGTLPFLIFAIVCNFTFKNREILIRTDSENEKFREFRANIRVVAVANGRFYGGGMEIAPRAKPDDGLLDVVIVKDMGSFETLKNMPLLYQGEKGFSKALDTGKVLYFRAKKVEIENSDNLMIEMEGEVPGHSPTKFEILPKQIKFLVP
ncbi:MAG: diacylglycerol kinase family lipid kinase [bacterium]|nr:diacylglycerol kinase family lipid kinase [bacterium]